MPKKTVPDKPIVKDDPNRFYYLHWGNSKFFKNKH